MVAQLREYKNEIELIQQDITKPVKINKTLRLKKIQEIKNNLEVTNVYKKQNGGQNKTKVTLKELWLKGHNKAQ